MKRQLRALPQSLPPSRPVEMTVGAYRPCFEIGAGGMATVYIAREAGNSDLRRTVALKVMHEHLTRTERFKQRFLDEARVLTHITHPYVCHVLAFGEENGRPYMAMDYLVGEPLSRVQKAMRRRVDGLCCGDRARLFARVIADVAEGLHAAHETCDSQGRPLGVVHRDVSPQNLFLMYDGTVRVLDFGIARYRDRYVQTATTGRLIGKLPYMAPEQIRGLEYDRRVDIWALGVVLWELVTLERLFRRETEVRTMDAVCSDPIAKASEIAEGVPEGLDEILARALSRNPEQRYQTAADFSHDLELWLANTGRPVTHAEVADFLGTFFPDSQKERQRWAEESNPRLEMLRDCDPFAEDTTPSLSLPKQLPRDEDLVTNEHTPTLTYVPLNARPTLAPAKAISEPPETHVSAVAVSIRQGSESASSKPRGRTYNALLGTVALGTLAIVHVFGNPGTGASSNEPAMAAAQPQLSIQLAPPTFPQETAPPLASESPRPSSVARPGAAVVAPTLPKPVMPQTAPVESRAQLGTGDVLVVSGTPVDVYLGARLLGRTPLRTRLPAGGHRLSVQLSESGPRTPIAATVTAGQLNIVTLR